MKPVFSPTRVALFSLVIVASPLLHAAPKVTPTPTPPPTHIFAALVPVAPIAVAPENRFNWLNIQQQQDLTRLLPAPPLTGSPEEQQDLAQVLKAQDARTPADIAEAQGDDEMKIELMTGPIGSSFTERKYPTTRKFLRQLIAEADILTRRVAYLHKRDRPYVAHLEVKPLFTEKGYGYPSAHAVKAHLLAIVLQQLFPDNSKDFLDRSEVICQTRINAGVADPTDITAGKTLAEALLQALTTDDQFQKDLQDVQAEVKRRQPEGSKDHD